MKLKFIYKIEKRQRLIISTMLLSALYIVATFFSFEWGMVFVPLIAVAVYALTYFGILEGITKHERIMLFIHPIYFSIALYLLYFFVPQRWLTRLPFVTIYMVSIYALFLSQNIFNVGVVKSLQLFRAAFSVNYLFLTISSFLAYTLIISLRLNPGFNMLLVFFASFPLVTHMLWSVEPMERVEKSILAHSALISLIIAEAGLILSFLPVNQSIYALVLTSLFYSLSGLFSTHMMGVLFKEKIREYVFVCAFAFAVLLLTL